MRTTRLELPDGRLVTIEGGDAPDIARFISNHYLGAGLVPDREGEEPLPLPAPTFTNQTVERKWPLTISNNGLDGGSPDELPLELPVVMRI